MIPRLDMGPAALRAAAAALAWVLAFAPAAQAAFMVPGSPWRPKDFAFFKKDGVYHLFYIRHNTQLPLGETELDFGHATSLDLFFWTQQPVTFAVDPDNWDNEHVWAPHILESNGFFWMFYTGVTVQPGFNHTQRMGLAYSDDLVTWRRYTEPILAAADVPWAWWNPANPGAGFRDPFIMADPSVPGQWLMYYTGYPAADTTGSIVGIARSNAFDSGWTDLKPLWVTHKSFTFNPLTESPHVVPHNGEWYLFITTSSGQPLTIYTSPDPKADPAGWTYRGRLGTMLGYDTSFWYASEHLRDGLRDYFAFVSGDRIDIREMLWSQTDWKFQLVQAPLLHCQSMDWLADSVLVDSTTQLHVQAVNVFGGLLGVEAVVDLPGVGPTAVPAESLGISDPLPLLGESTSVDWVARRWPASLADSLPLRVKVRTLDQSAESDWITIVPQPTIPPPPPDPGEPEIRRWPARMRAVDLPSFASTGQGFAVTLDAPAEARIEIFDVSGRRQRLLSRRPFGAGVTLVDWDRRDDAGSRVAAGVYFARLEAGGVRGTARVVVLGR